MNRKIVLFNPAPRSGYQTPRRVELPLGLLSIATPLDREGYDVTIIDEFADPDWKKKLLQAIRDKPICFGVTCMTGPQILHAIEGCRILRTRNSNVPIVWGGVHASLMPEQTLQSLFADIVVTGEGEESFSEIVEALEQGTPLKRIKGICYQENGEFRSTGQRQFIDIDAFPFLSYHLIDIDRYRRTLFGIDHISINSSRGCTMGCKFCWDPVMHKRKWRAMKPATVLNHIERFVSEYGIRGFLFTDDNFFLDMKRAREIMEGVVDLKLNLSIGKLQIRADTVCRMDEDWFQLLLQANVKRLMIGAESGSQRILDLINKGQTIEMVIEANRKLAAYPIVPKFLFMMGLPTETPQDLKKSIELSGRLTSENSKAEASFNIFAPYPGTEMYDLVRELGLKEPDHLEDWSSFNFRRTTRGSWLKPEMRKLINGLDL
ncbi:B12-binding domain-containing radical SAM protein, partial [candidate division CSSED10-310 bacterium]